MTPGNVAPDGFTPLTVEEARELMTEALIGVDRDTLLAERAEAEAQLRAAEATLGRNGGEQEPDEPVQNRKEVDTRDGVDGELDVEALRRAATVARAADDELARAASEAGGFHPPLREAHEPDEDELGAAESAFARVAQMNEELPAAWRRLVGALISATGMAIVIGALGWNVYWLLVPIALIAIMTVDLRLVGKTAREASQELATVGAAGADERERIRLQRSRTEEIEGRLAAARAERDAAYARFEELAPGRLPSEVEEIVAEYEAREPYQPSPEPEARAEAADVAPVESEVTAADVEVEVEVEVEAVQAEAAPAPPEPAPAEPAPVTASEWWFGTKEAPPPPAAASAPVRALAERLSAEGREALARIEVQLAGLDRVELAKKSLEWHEANGSAGDGSPVENPSEEKP